MVSTKLALAMGAAALLQLASARDCTAQMVIDTGAMPTYHGVEARFSDNNELLDYQETGNTDGLDIFDGWQTLKSDKLGGDVRLKAEGELGSIKYALPCPRNLCFLFQTFSKGPGLLRD